MFFKSIFFTVSLLLFSTICETRTPVRRCSGDLPFPLYVQIADCDQLPCTITGGTTAKLDVQFVAIKDVTYYVEADIRLTMFGMRVPYAVPNDISAVCRNLMFGANCPLYAGEDVTYHINIPIDLVERNVKAEVKLFDLDNDVVACFTADLKIKRPKNSIK